MRWVSDPQGSVEVEGNGNIMDMIKGVAGILLVSAALMSHSMPANAGFSIPGSETRSCIFETKSEANMMSVERFSEEFLEIRMDNETLDENEKSVEKRDYSVLPKNTYDDQGLFFVSV
ncbi:MAG: hypothetical protein CVV64_05540 [Candidatus Wallbacteria bacterium HGW-Wallbacteria-1]|jgi:hypothetical protein|uniref:Uncharacterized protein n=1 Tax=Candidatus Wallbacteria bacterium HGW-Wallbacteria-1 TaxID=2013854 RepID=A0A2N1PSB9_9BACT|nr:MAG: hypothetical protein CVV64_05540 [Candidatus Wallbacteria bacterium HGW-Wallbacteria-1]